MTRTLQVARELYFGDSAAAHRFRYALLAFDLLMIAFIVVSSFFHGAGVVEVLDAVFGIIILVDTIVRIAASERRWSEALQPGTIVDFVVIASLLAPVTGENLAFLRVLRALRLLRSYRIIRRLRQDVPFFRRHQDVILAAVNLGLFIFVMTALVFETQIDRNANIRNFADALYFTVTTLTTTGFGDITLPNTEGRLLSVAIMIFGVSLFLRLIQVLFRPSRKSWRCSGCGLTRHEADAIHCRHCGTLLNRPHEDYG
ncbi:MAG: ion channel [Dongiaceae bacterium]